MAAAREWWLCSAPESSEEESRRQVEALRQVLGLHFRAFSGMHRQPARTDRERRLEGPLAPAVALPLLSRQLTLALNASEEPLATSRLKRMLEADWAAQAVRSASLNCLVTSFFHPTQLGFPEPSNFVGWHTAITVQVSTAAEHLKSQKFWLSHSLLRAVREWERGVTIAFS